MRAPARSAAPTDERSSHGRSGRGHRATQPMPAAVPTRAEVTATLTAPGRPFEMEEMVIRGIPTRTWKTAPATLRAVFELSALHGDKDFLVYEDERVTFDQHFRIVAALAHQLVERFGIRPGRPGGHRHAQPPRVGHGLLGHHRRRRRGRAPQRLVDRRRAGLRAGRLGRQGGLRGRGAPARIRPHLADLPGLERRDRVLRGARSPTGGRRAAVAPTPRAIGASPCPWSPSPRWSGPPADDVALPEVDGRSRRRRHHLLHVRHHRSAQGGGRHPPQQLLQPDEPVLRRHRGRPAPERRPRRTPAAAARTPTCCRSRCSTPPGATPCW